MVRRRRMVRDFSDEPVARPLIEELVANATHIPSAGYSQGFAFVVLTEPDQRRLFWETTSGPEWRGESESVPLTRAPVVIVPLAHKQAYLDRYALPDKVHTPLSREEHWPAPYWDIDTGFGVMLILLTAVDLGLGALFFGIFQGEQALMDALGVPEGYRPIGADRRGLSDGGRALQAGARDRTAPPRRGREVGALVTSPFASAGRLPLLAGAVVRPGRIRRGPGGTPRRAGKRRPLASPPSMGCQRSGPCCSHGRWASSKRRWRYRVSCQLRARQQTFGPSPGRSGCEGSRCRRSCLS